MPGAGSSVCEVAAALSVTALSALRFILAAPVFIPFIKKIDRRCFFQKPVMFLCLMQPCLNLLFQTFGLKSTSVSGVAYISAFGPVITVLCSWLISKTPPSRKQYLPIAAVTAGAALTVFGKSGGETTFAGAALVLLSLLTRSIYAVKVRKVLKSTSALSMSAAQVFWGLIFYLAAAFISGGLPDTARVFFALTPVQLVSLLYVSLLSLSGVYFLNNYSLGKISAVTGGILSNITFAATLLSGIIFLREPVTLTGIAGAAVIVVGVILLARVQNKTS